MPRGHSPHRFTAAIALTCAIGLAIAGPTAAPAAAKSRSPAVTARQLARGIAQARTPARRYRSLRAVMKAMHVGVYRGNGRAIARGAERDRKDLYVYDFTLRLLAEAVADRQTISGSELAARLTAVLAPLKRPAIGAARLRSVLRSSVRWARRHPRDKGALVPLLVRELGRRSVHQDLTKPPAAKALRFDAAQAFVLTADVAGAVSNRAHHRRARVRRAESAVRGARPAGVCEDFRPLYEAYENGKTGATLIRGIRAIANWVGDAVVGNATKGALNFALIDELVTVTGSSPNGEITHYGPGPHEGSWWADRGGSALDFQVHVEASKKLPDLVARCGYLAGVNLPLRGGVPEVPVGWQDQSPSTSESLAGNGVVWDPDAQTNTGGDAGYHFTPHDERLRGVGHEEMVGRGRVLASVNLQEAIGGPALSLSPNVWALMPPKTVEFPYQVWAHRAAGYRFNAGAPFTWTHVNHGDGTGDVVWSGSTADTVTGYVCREDPGTSWQGTVSPGEWGVFPPWGHLEDSPPVFLHWMAPLPFGVGVPLFASLRDGPPLSVRLNDTDPASVTVSRAGVSSRTSPIPGFGHLAYSDEPQAPGSWTVNVVEDTEHCLPR